MTVRAAHLTFREFRLYPLPRNPRADQLANIPEFSAANMIEFEDSDIGFTAVHAGMVLQIHGNAQSVLVTALALARISSLVINGSISTVVLSAVLALAIEAISTPRASLLISDWKLPNW